MYPIIYTPTEADAISEYSHLFRRSEGLFLSAPYEDKMEVDFLDACEGRELELVRLTQTPEGRRARADRADRGFGRGGDSGDWGSGMLLPIPGC
jgi:malate dehydrogenase (oxaloacetate-decarboxylating)